MIVSSRRPLTSIALAVVALVALDPGRAEAQAPKPDAAAKRVAQVHLDRGNALFTRDAFGDALREFEAAFALFPSPKLHLNLGQCERALGHDDAAAEHFQRFLDEARDVSPALRAEAEHHLAAARASAERAKAPAPPEPPPPTPPAPAVEPPAPAILVAPAAAAPALEAPMPSLAPTPTRDEPRRPLTRRWWFWTGLGAVAVAAGVSIFLLARSGDPKCEAGPSRCF